MKIRNMVGIAGAFAAAGLMSSAQAALVTSWDYSVETEFKDGTSVFNGTSGTFIQNNGRQVSWGFGGTTPDPGSPGIQDNVFFNTGSTLTNRSGLTISDEGAGTNDQTVDPQTGVVVTGATTVPGIGLGAWITHHNNAISGTFSTLLRTQIDSTLTLKPIPQTDPPTTFGPTTINFTIYFAETVNATPCTAPSPVGNPCNDIFALNFSDAFNQKFQYDGVDYFVSTFPLAAGGGLGTFLPLSDAECLAAGANTGCVGFTTVEGQDTTVRFGFAITGEPIRIPEPGILALLGGSLFGLAAFRRRRTS